MGDREWMDRALALAARGRGQTSPNPMVGALVVSPAGELVGEGFHARAGQAHAEIVALERAGERARAATLYSTLEPCSHHGRTGPCVEAIAAAGVTRVCAAMEDPNPLVRGRGFEWLRARGVAVDCGIAEAEARRLNEAFVRYMESGRPFVHVKAAMSLDGRIAARPGARTALSGPAATRWVRELRAECDALAVGVGTILADDPLLTVRGAVRTRPLARVIFDSRLQTSPAARVVGTLDAGPVIVLTTAAALEASPGKAATLRARGVTIEPQPVEQGRVDLAGALRWMAAREIVHLVVEGGAGLIGALLSAGVVDKMSLIVTPTLLGSGGLSLTGAADFGRAPIRFASISHEVCGEDLVWHGYPMTR